VAVHGEPGDRLVDVAGCRWDVGHRAQFAGVDPLVEEIADQLQQRPTALDKEPLGQFR
jgi:hypothetical protein